MFLSSSLSHRNRQEKRDVNYHFKWNNQISCLNKWYEKTPVMQESLFIKGIKDSIWHPSGGDTCRLPREPWHKTHTRSRAASPLIVSVSNHRLALGTKVEEEEEEEGCRAGGSGGGGVGQLGEGEKRGKISFRALRLLIPLTHSD